MNKGEAYRLLAAELASFRRMSFSELADVIGLSRTTRVQNADGSELDVQVEINWRNSEHTQILVEGTVHSIDWGGPLARVDDCFTVNSGTMP